MERERYQRLVSEVVRGVDRKRLGTAMSIEKPVERMDAVTRLLRGSLLSSSVGMYNSQMYHYGGKIYEVIEYDDFGNLVYDVLRELELPEGDYSRVEGVIRVCRRVVTTKQLRVSGDVVVFRNGVYDVENNRLEEFSSKYVQFGMVDYDYDPKARGFLWQAFLDQVLPNKAYQRILQEFVGALYIDRRKVRMETMLMLLGSGANGKSVIFDTITGVVGEKGVSNFGIDELIGKGTERKRNIASLNGKRLNYASETGQFTIDGSSGVLKALISGEPVEARALYGNNFTAYDIPLIMINCNRLPQLKDFSQGMRRRLMVIPFNVEIPRSKQNKMLSYELRAEYPAIFNWAMAGRTIFLGEGCHLPESEVLEEIVEDYQMEGSGILSFMAANGYLRRDRQATDAVPVWWRLSRIYTEYKVWCHRTGEDAQCMRSASQMLREYGYKRRRTGNGTEFAIYGETARRAERRRKKEFSKIMEIEDAEARMASLDMKKSEYIKARCEQVFGWKRIAVGIKDLIKQTQMDCDFKKEIYCGRMDGCFRKIEGIYIFNLDMVESCWMPLYEQRRIALMERRKRKEKAEKERDLLMRTGAYRDVMATMAVNGLHVEEGDDEFPLAVDDDDETLRTEYEELQAAYGEPLDVSGILSMDNEREDNNDNLNIEE